MASVHILVGSAASVVASVFATLSLSLSTIPNLSKTIHQTKGGRGGREQLQQPQYWVESMCKLIF